MTASKIVPLFVLPMGIFPLTQEPLRVFEPRYKQMLDDCILEDAPFGYVATVNPPEGVGGWAMPAEYGVLCTADGLEEQGSNLLFTASGETRFRVVEVLPASLTARDFGEIFPSVDELVEEYIEESPDGKLYLRAEIEALPPLREIVHNDRWNKLVRRWSEHIVEIDSLVRASGMGLEDVLPIMEGEFLPYTESGLWSACQSILDGYDDRQRALSSDEAGQVMDVLEGALGDKKAQMDAIRFMMESE
jgi:Lon protease-like protein